MDRSYKKILVIGSSGFIGKNLVLQCINKGYQVIGIDIINDSFSHDNYKFYNRSLFDFNYESLDFNEIDIVYHLAAKTDIVTNNLGDYNLNFKFPTDLIACCNKFKIRFIYFSTQLVHAYGKEDNPVLNADTFYGVSKILGEMHVKNLFENYQIIRPSSVWGPGMSRPYSEFFKLLKSFKFIIVSDLFDVNKSFYYVGKILYDTENFTGNLLYLANQPVKLSHWMSMIAKFKKFKVFKISSILIKTIFYLGGLFRVKILNKRRLINMTTSTKLTSFIRLSDNEFDNAVKETWKSFE